MTEVTMYHRMVKRRQTVKEEIPSECSAPVQKGTSAKAVAVPKTWAGPTVRVRRIRNLAGNAGGTRITEDHREVGDVGERGKNRVSSRPGEQRDIGVRETVRTSEGKKHEKKKKQTRGLKVQKGRGESGMPRPINNLEKPEKPGKG